MSNIESAQVLSRAKDATAPGTGNPNVPRRVNRQHTIRSYQPPTGPNLEPGAEPGIDTGKDDETELVDFNQVCAHSARQKLK